MKIWKDFVAAAKGKEVTFVIPGIHDDGVSLCADGYEITDEALIWTGDDGDIRWIPLARIGQGKIIMPAAEE